MDAELDLFDINGVGYDLLVLPDVDIKDARWRDLNDFSRVVFENMPGVPRSFIEYNVKLIAISNKMIRFYTRDLYVQVPYTGSIKSVLYSPGNSEYSPISYGPSEILYGEIEIGYGKGVSRALLKYTNEELWYDLDVVFLSDTVGDDDMIEKIRLWSSVMFDLLLSDVRYDIHIKDVSYIGFDMDDPENEYTWKCRIYDTNESYVELTLGYDDFKGGGMFLSDVTYG